MSARLAAAGSPGEVLELVRTGQARTRGELMGATGMSRSTVMQRLSVLLGAGSCSSGPRRATRKAAGARRRWPSTSASG
jgi:DNA-binding transcriptional ArsR family regulator